MLHFSRWKTFFIWGFALLGVLCAAPNLIPEKDLASYPQFVQNLRLNLGLDLRGGSHLLLKMDKDLLIEKQIKVLRGNVRTVLRGKRDPIPSRAPRNPRLHRIYHHFASS